MKLKCPSPYCGKIWEYHGRNRYPSRTNCPDCERKTLILEYKEEEYDKNAEAEKMLRKADLLIQKLLKYDLPSGLAQKREELFEKVIKR
jgi:hypothetical protein